MVGGVSAANHSVPLTRPASSTASASMAASANDMQLLRCSRRAVLSQASSIQGWAPQSWPIQGWPTSWHLRHRHLQRILLPHPWLLLRTMHLLRCSHQTVLPQASSIQGWAPQSWPIQGWPTSWHLRHRMPVSRGAHFACAEVGRGGGTTAHLLRPPLIQVDATPLEPSLSRRARGRS